MDGDDDEAFLRELEELERSHPQAGGGADAMMQQSNNGNLFAQFQFRPPLTRPPTQAITPRPLEVSHAATSSSSKPVDALAMLRRERVVPLQIAQEPRSEQGVDHGAREEELAEWLYPESLKFPRRDYQFNMVRTALQHNTMICLPTGLGKTFIAATVMANFFNWHPEGKVIFMAPTKPLVTQQADACYNQMGIPYEHISEMTGQMETAKRKEEWKSKRAFFVTPQVVKNDLMRGFLRAEQIVCLVFDEAHRATGNYAYVNVARAVAQSGAHCRILALTATPARDAVGVQAVIDNLSIARLEVKSEQDIDIQSYVHSKFTQKVVLKLTPTMERIMAAMAKQMEPLLGQLCHLGAYYNANADNASAYALRMEYQRFIARQNEANPGARNPNIGYAYQLQMQASLWARGRDLLRIHGLQPLLKWCEELREQGPSNKAISKMISQAPFGQVYGLARKAFEAGEVHPKQRELLRLLQEHFDGNPDSRVIIFTSLRVSVDALVELVSQQPLVRCSRFVGQASSKGDSTVLAGVVGSNAVGGVGGGNGGGAGQKQKEQRDVIERFVRGQLNTLVATCVGEEGLDVGECDLIILYDSTASPIRMVQRVGRTGRKRQGRVVALLTDGAEDRQYDSTKLKGQHLLKSLIRDKGKFRFYEAPLKVSVALVPGTGGKLRKEPTPRDVAEPPVPIERCRALRSSEMRSRNGGRAARGGAGAARVASQERERLLSEAFGIAYRDDAPLLRLGEEDEDDDEGFDEEDVISVLMKRQAADQDVLNATHTIGHSLRTLALRDLLGFVSESDGMFGGLVVQTLMLPSRPPLSAQRGGKGASSTRLRAPARPLYSSGSEDNDEDDALVALYGAGYSRKEDGGGGDGVVEAGENLLDDDDDDDDWKNFYDPRRPVERVQLSARKDVVVTTTTEEVQDDYAPSNAWFAKPIEQRPEPVVDSVPPASIVVPRTPPPASRHVSLGVTPPSSRPPGHVTPKIDTRDVLRGADFRMFPEQICQAARRLLDPPAHKALFLPPAPSFHHASVARVTVDCPQCGCQFPDSVALGFHCFRQHWPVLDAPLQYNPNPISFSEPLSSSSSSSAASVSSLAALSSAPTVLVKPAPPAAPLLVLAPASPVTPSLSLSDLSRPQSARRTSYSSSHVGMVVESPESGSFEVEAILDEQLKEDGSVMYLLRWSGFGSQECTWEPESSLIPGAERLLRDWKATRREQQARVPKRSKKTKRKPRGADARSFLDLEAHLSGSEASSDEVDDDGDGAEHASWVVDDDADIIYSQSASLSQREEADIGFYRRANALADESPSPIIDIVKRKKKRASKPPKRLRRKRDDGGDDNVLSDVLVVSSQQPPVATSVCLVCGGRVVSGTLCADCETGAVGEAVPAENVEEPSPILVSTRDMHAQVVSHLMQSLRVPTAFMEFPSFDADYVLGPRLAVLRNGAKSLSKNPGKLFSDIAGAMHRNERVVMIVEMAGSLEVDGAHAAYERTLAELASIPGLGLLFCRSNEQSAHALQQLRDHADRFLHGAAWIQSRAGEISFLSCAPGIGVARAVHLLETFPSLSSICNASAADLGRALRLSSPAAAELVRFFSSSTPQ